MSDFKIGDKVRITDLSGLNTKVAIGDVGTIVEPDTIGTSFIEVLLERVGYRQQVDDWQIEKVDENAPIGRELKTLEARIVNGFLVYKVETYECSLRLKNVSFISVNKKGNICYLEVSETSFVNVGIKNNSTLPEILDELGVNL